MTIYAPLSLKGHSCEHAMNDANDIRRVLPMPATCVTEQLQGTDKHDYIMQPRSLFCHEIPNDVAPSELAAQEERPRAGSQA